MKKIIGSWEYATVSVDAYVYSTFNIDINKQANKSICMYLSIPVCFWFAILKKKCEQAKFHSCPY